MPLSNGRRMRPLQGGTYDFQEPLNQNPEEDDPVMVSVIAEDKGFLDSLDCEEGDGDQAKGGDQAMT